jgi:3-octaprenyl-4-hydroxybenzoate carboxy-lyase
LYGAAYFKGDSGKICQAVDEDIDPDNANALFWAMAYRMKPVARPKREYLQRCKVIWGYLGLPTLRPHSAT